MLIGNKVKFLIINRDKWDVNLNLVNRIATSGKVGARGLLKIRHCADDANHQMGPIRYGFPKLQSANQSELEETSFRGLGRHLP
jgi:hypothetical protein